MWFFWIVCLLLATLLIYPYASVVLCRRAALKRIGDTVRRSGGRMRRLRRTALFSRNRASWYDLWIEKGEIVYAVKLWSARRRQVDLLISSDGLVAEEHVTREPLTPKRNVKERVLRSRFRPVPKTKLSLPVPKGKTLCKILLIYPSYQSVRGYHHMQWVEIQSGARIFDKLFYSPSAFEKLLAEE